MGTEAQCSDNDSSVRRREALARSHTLKCETMSSPPPRHSWEKKHSHIIIICLVLSNSICQLTFLSFSVILHPFGPEFDLQYVSICSPVSHVFKLLVKQIPFSTKKHSNSHAFSTITCIDLNRTSKTETSSLACSCLYMSTWPMSQVSI